MESILNFEHFEEKMSFIAQVFWKLVTPKKALTLMRKRSCLWTPFHSEPAKESQKLLKSEKGTFILLSHHFEPAWNGKIYFQSNLKF